MTIKKTVATAISAILAALAPGGVPYAMASQAVNARSAAPSFQIPAAAGFVPSVGAASLELPALSQDVSAGLSAAGLAAPADIPVAPQAQADAALAPAAVTGFEAPSGLVPSSPNAKPTAGLPGVVAEPSRFHADSSAASQSQESAAPVTSFGSLQSLGARIGRGSAQPALNATFENSRAAADGEVGAAPTSSLGTARPDLAAASSFAPQASAKVPYVAPARAQAWGVGAVLAAAPILASISTPVLLAVSAILPIALYFFFRPAASASGDSAAQAEAKSMAGGRERKPEVFFPDMYRGRMDLLGIFRAHKKLSPERQEVIDAWKTLIRIGLWPKAKDPAGRNALLAQLDAPTPAMREALAMTGLDVETVRSWNPVVDPHQVDVDNDTPPEVMQRASELGLFRLKVPKRYGGLGLHQVEYGQILETFAEISFSIGTNVSADNTIGSAPMLMFGTKAQKKTYLEKKAKGRALAAFGLTEPGAGTDTKKVATTAELPDLGLDLSKYDWLSDPAKARAAGKKKIKEANAQLRAEVARALAASGKSATLSGEKIFITGLIDAEVVYLVAGHTMYKGRDLGPTVFIVDLPFLLNETFEQKIPKLRELRDRGMRITSFTRDGFGLPVIRGTDQSYIQMNGFQVPGGNILGGIGQGIQIPLMSLNAGRIGFGPILSKAATWFSSQMLGWAMTRQMFDMYKTSDKPAVQADMENAQVKIGAAQRKAAALRAVARMTSALADDNAGMGLASLSAAIKARVASQAWEIASDARELGGGHALMIGAPAGIEREVRNAWITKIVEGQDDAMKQAVHLFAGFSIQFEMMNPLKAMKWMFNQVMARLPELVALPILAGAAFLTLSGGLPLLGAWLASNALLAAGIAAGAAAAWLASYLYLSAGRGAIGRSDAAFIQKQTARFSARFLMTAFLLEKIAPLMPSRLRKALGFEEMARRQRMLIRAFEPLMDLYTLAAVRDMLATDKSLSARERLALDGAAKMLRRNIGRALWDINPWGNSEDAADRELGKAIIAEAAKEPAALENTFEDHDAWIRRYADAWWSRVDARFAPPAK
ncbi:MAG TPA: acyl-CoA dehydrogenase family protein [Elusimicrobiota bacterium]|nr:acyl-CoA dehydrogenase family protein [Elusimicrobiota bacterium]